MTSIMLWENNGSATLAASITNAQTYLTLTSGEGALFPSPGTGQFFSLTLISASNPATFEIVYCTARATDTLSITRAQEGTTATAFNAGDLVEGLLTKGQMNLLAQTAQFAPFGGSSNSGSPNIATSVNITAVSKCLVFVNGVAGQDTGDFSSVTFSNTGGTLVSVNGNNSYGATSNLAVSNAIFSMTSGSSMTITFTMAGSGRSTAQSNIGITYFTIPTP